MPLMGEPENSNRTEHIINIPNVALSRDEAFISSLHEDRTSSSGNMPFSSLTSTSDDGSHLENSSLFRRGDARRQRSPLNSGLWISVEFSITVSQIVAAIVVLSVSRNEHPRTPLFAWIVGYTCGCVATLPLLCWRYHHRAQGSNHGLAHTRQASTHINVPTGPFSVSVSRSSEDEEHHASITAPLGLETAGVHNSRLKVLVDYLKMILDCFFAIWFIVGNVWIFGGHSSADAAPNMYRLCIVFFTISCIGYALPFILCAVLCCCLPCIISMVGLREDLGQSRGASQESINSLPTYKFWCNSNINASNGNAILGTLDDGGVVARGTEKERVISEEDAVCCICLAKYTNNDDLRELPCSHFFHKECVDKWLKINACCPLCKMEVGTSGSGSSTRSSDHSYSYDSSQQHADNAAAHNGDAVADTFV